MEKSFHQNLRCKILSSHYLSNDRDIEAVHYRISPAWFYTTQNWILIMCQCIFLGNIVETYVALASEFFLQPYSCCRFCPGCRFELSGDESIHTRRMFVKLFNQSIIIVHVLKTKHGNIVNEVMICQWQI